jgi:type I restriction enzyme S subunit
LPEQARTERRTQKRPVSLFTGGLTIPADWSIPSLHEICRAPITYGIVQCGPHVRDGVPYIRVSDMEGPELDVTTMLRTDPEIAAKFRRSTVQEGDLVYALRGRIGDIRKVRDTVSGANLTQGTARIAPKQEIYGDYLLWAMRSPRVVGQAELQAKGTTFREITLAGLRGLNVPLPPTKAEQRAIAEALSDVDTLLGALDQLVAKKRDLKQAAMQQLLTGKTRLPGFNLDWTMTRVFNLGDVVTGGTPRTDVAEYWGGEYPWVTPTDITKRRDMFDSERRLTQKGLDAIRPLPPNSVLVTCIASIGKNAILKVPGACNQQINAVIPNRTNDSLFLYYVFEASQRYLQANAGTTATSILSKKAFSELLFRVPELEEQTAIATVLSDMDAELEALEARRAKTRDLKQAMMQELLTGKTRLVQAEVAQPEAAYA